jgi:hypothetical protein
MIWLSQKSRLAAFVIAMAVSVVLASSADAGTVFYQKNFSEMGQVPNTAAGICSAAANVNSFIYLRNHYPGVYANTNLLPDWNGDGQLTQSDYNTSRDKLAYGWVAGGKTRTGMYPAGTPQTIWETTHYWLEDFAPGTSVMGGRVYTNDLVHQWAGGETLETSNPWYPEWDFLWDSLVAAQDITLGLRSSSAGYGAHAVTLTGLAFDDADGDGLWDSGETPQKIGFSDPNHVSAQVIADVTIGLLHRVEFTWWQNNQPYYIYRAFTEGPHPAITFGEWAANQGWTTGHVMLAGVDAGSAFINSLTGIGNYNWTTTPTVYLDLGGNQITSIESGAFTGLGNLQQVWLNGNQITSIESSDFVGLDNLTQLYLNSNQITSIESRAFTGLGNLTTLDLSANPALTSLNLERANFSSLSTFDVSNNTGIARVSLKNAILNQTSLVSIITGGTESWCTGIGELSGITKLDLSGVDFSAITDLSPLYVMDSLTDLWLVGVLNMDATALDTLLDNLMVMEDPSIEGALYLTQADYDAFNTAGGGKLAIWDAEAGHHVDIVEIIGLGDANADGLVDDADATILASHWHQMGGASWFDGDFNGDGNVTDADASILAAHWHVGVEALTSNVPEPGALAMLAGAVVSLSLLAHRQRRGR